MNHQISPTGPSAMVSDLRKENAKQNIKIKKENTRATAPGQIIVVIVMMTFCVFRGEMFMVYMSPSACADHSSHHGRKG